MDMPTVTYTGEEVALIVALIASGLPSLNQADYDVADLMLDKALASLHRPLADDLELRIAQLRSSPLPHEGR